jgi:hypothetical protein
LRRRPRGRAEAGLFGLWLTPPCTPTRPCSPRPPAAEQGASAPAGPNPPRPLPRVLADTPERPEEPGRPTPTHPRSPITGRAIAMSPSAGRTYDQSGGSSIPTERKSTCTTTSVGAWRSRGWGLNYSQSSQLAAGRGCTLRLDRCQEIMSGGCGQAGNRPPRPGSARMLSQDRAATVPRCPQLSLTGSVTLSEVRLRRALAGRASNDPVTPPLSRKAPRMTPQARAALAQRGFERWRRREVLSRDQRVQPGGSRCRDPRHHIGRFTWLCIPPIGDAHPPLPAGAEVDNRVGVVATQHHRKLAAGRGWMVRLDRCQVITGDGCGEAGNRPP